MLVATKVKMSGSEKKSEQIHIQHFLHKMFSNAKQRKRNVQKSLLHIRVFVKI